MYMSNKNESTIGSFSKSIERSKQSYLKARDEYHASLLAAYHELSNQGFCWVVMTFGDSYDFWREDVLASKETAQFLASIKEYDEDYYVERREKYKDQILIVPSDFVNSKSDEIKKLFAGSTFVN
jgi:hypothetical protein